MIVRDRKEFSDSKEISGRFSFSEVDVRKALIKSLSNYVSPYMPELASHPWTEQELRDSLHKVLFYNFPSSSVDAFTKWAFRAALREKFITASATKENCYFFTDKIKSKVKSED